MSLTAFQWEHTPVAQLPFIALDLETTGYAPPSARITEVALIFNGPCGEESFNTLIDPEIPIPPEITRITGITDAMVSGKPTIGEIAPILARILDNGIFVSHNVPFDWNFINQAFRDHLGKSLTMPSMCTLKLSRKFLGLTSNALGSVAAHIGFRHQHAHRAMGDTLAVKGLLAHFLNLFECKGFKTGGDLCKHGIISPPKTHY